MIMKISLMILAFIVLQSSGVQTKPHKEPPPKVAVFSKEFKASAELALEAIERLDEARNEPRDSYEPRRLDAEKALADTERKAKTADDKHVAEVLEKYFQGLRNERDPNLSNGRESKTGVEYWEQFILPCKMEGEWYLTTELAKMGLASVHESKCTPPKSNKTEKP
jgi:hypothetical protein